jgi:hypothetical protein
VDWFRPPVVDHAHARLPSFYQAYDSKMKFCWPVVALFHSIKRTRALAFVPPSRQQHHDGAIIDYSKELPRGINFNSVPRFISSKSSCPHFKNSKHQYSIASKSLDKHMMAILILHLWFVKETPTA